MCETTPSPERPVEILIAEDSPTQAQRLKHILEKQGYTVIHAVNGRQALETAQQIKPTLIISDVVMPEMDGYEFCRRVKKDANLEGIPVILVTTLSDPGDVISGLECHADNFIVKPYDERYLLGQVQFALLNCELRKTDHGGMGVEVFFNNKRHFITADRIHILNLLLSTYDAAIQRNKELNRVQKDLQLLNASLENANKELETFSYSVSHDLRAPLRHIEGFINLLEKRASPILDQQSLRYITTISESANRMATLIDDLLSFSRMSRADLVQVETDLRSLAEAVVKDFEPETSQREVEINLGELPKAPCDAAMIRQVFANLIGNALKFTRNREKTIVEVGALSQEFDRVVVFVRDNGVGFDMTHAKKLFGVFQRLHSQDKFEGTGIGLANVRRIVRRHGGDTWAEGEIDKGATFFFSLPKKQAGSQAS